MRYFWVGLLIAGPAFGQPVAPGGGASSGVSGSPVGPVIYTQTAVTVPANTSTQLIAANTARKTLALIPGGGNQTCLINPSGNPASATSMPIPGGWSYDQATLPPSSAVTAYCLTAATVSITEGN